jgi:N-carbamoylputrescine amidase
MSRLLKIGLAQQSSHLSRKLALEATEKGIVEAARQGAGLVLLQELHAGIYFCQHENQDTFNTDFHILLSVIIKPVLFFR